MNDSNRMIYLDMVRGFSILGILISNLSIFAETSFGMGFNQTVYSPYILGLIYFFITGKFFIIFSFVFGYGFTILMRSLEQKRGDTSAIYYRRLMGLVILGVLHTILFFQWDILVSYGIMGFFLYKLKGKSDNQILHISIGFWILSIIFYGVLGFLGLVTTWEDPAKIKELADISIQGYRGDFWEATLQRIREMPLNALLLILFNWPSAFMMFLLGFWAGRKKILENPETFFDRIRQNLLPILAIGCIANVLYAWGNLDVIGIFHSIVCNAMLGFGGISFALLYCYALHRIAESQNMKLDGIKNWLATVGSMSLTNYLMQSVILSWVFNGWGLGFYAELSPEIYILFVIPVFLWNVGFSVLWKKYFSVGPFEYFLRKITYGS